MIDRSKPLPIHEFPNLISEVAKLKELCSDPCTSLEERIMMKRTVPKLLDVLGEIRAGDADSLDFMLDYLCDDPNDNNDPEIEIAKKVLHRYRDIAQKMEAESNER